MKYLIIDEMSMVGRKIFGQVDKRFHQAFPHQADQLFGGCSCLLFGDFGQLPPVAPVMDLPLYTVSRTHLSDLGSTAYQMFNHAVVLEQVIRQSGQAPDQVLFRKILLNLRNGQITIEDWRYLMKQTPTQLQDLTLFRHVLHLHPTVEAIVEHSISRLRASGQPIATIKAIHTGPNASKASPDYAAGLEFIISIAQ
jgi:ATP-dependent DNA helicase PIF1